MSGVLGSARHQSRSYVVKPCDIGFGEIQITIDNELWLGAGDTNVVEQAVGYYS